MIGATKELQQDHVFSSRPEHWPFMIRGVAYWLDRDSNVSYYRYKNTHNVYQEPYQEQTL